MDFTEFVMSNYKKCFLILFTIYFLLIGLALWIMAILFPTEEEVDKDK